MSFVAPATYAARIAPALALIALLLLLWKSLASLVESQRLPPEEDKPPNASFWQCLLAAYLILLHIITASIPLRAFRALGYVISKTEEKARDLSPLQSLPMQSLLIFAIIIPAYKETVDTLGETLGILASHPHAQACYDIYLAIEEREEGSQVKAQHLRDRFRDGFHKMHVTVHPQIPGEAPGKSSNQSWAAKQIVKDYDLPLKDRPYVFVTTMDSDSHLSWRYFVQIAEDHATLPDQEARNSTLYMAPVVFDRNAHQVPLLVRCADIFWNGAGISTMCKHSAVSIPTSVYTLPLALLETVDRWDTDDGAIGEDMHMFLKCFFALNGNLRTKVIHAPASQCNVCSEYRGIRGYADCIRARHQQSVRHMWGMVDMGFAICLAMSMFIRRFQVRRTRLLCMVSRNVRRCGQPTVLSSYGSGQKEFHRSTHRGMQAIQHSNVRTVFRRLFEAHIVPLHVMVAVALPALYQSVRADLQIPVLLASTLHLCNLLRLLSLFILLIFIQRYGRYYDLCRRLRASDQRASDPKRAETTELVDEVRAHRWRIVHGLLEIAASLIAGLLFGALPALQATIMHLWTTRLQYMVSFKPLLAPSSPSNFDAEQAREEGRPTYSNTADSDKSNVAAKS